MKQDWEGKELDKDILVPNNKVYSPDTCVFIDKKVNQLFSKKNKHGVFGVSYDKKKNIYILTSSTVNQQKAKYSGSYRTLEDAKKASHQMREEYILQVASEQKDERVKKAVLGLIDLHHHTS
jgi:hypothetical protein